MVDLRFEDPPEYREPRVLTLYDARKNSDRRALVEALTGHPDRWAVVSVHLSRNRAAQVARLLRSRHPSHEFRASRSEEGGGVVYGRYVIPDANIR